MVIVEKMAICNIYVDIVMIWKQTVEMRQSEGQDKWLRDLHLKLFWFLFVSQTRCIRWRVKSLLLRRSR